MRKKMIRKGTLKVLAKLVWPFVLPLETLMIEISQAFCFHCKSLRPPNGSTDVPSISWAIPILKIRGS